MSVSIYAYFVFQVPLPLYSTDNLQRFATLLPISCQLNVRQYIPHQTADTLSAAKTAALQYNYITSVFITYPAFLTPIQLITHRLNFLSNTFLRASYHALRFIFYQARWLSPYEPYFVALTLSAHHTVIRQTKPNLELSQSSQHCRQTASVNI